ncbi:hypothetical protein [Cytobacillus gottheilii]|uniref:hypothetical protein n=1 Tax=Cytobacillus gottheilii TaxID=859144 RepID=UPI0011188D5B|nr:hypothetical protein [Cytobacillus gottheilii]
MTNEKRRDSERIMRILHLIQEIWGLNPDMRFFQLLVVLKHEYSSENNGFGRREGFEIDSKGHKMPISYLDLFYLEDKEFEEYLRAFVSEH